MRVTSWLCSAVMGALLASGQANAPDACQQAKEDLYRLYFVKSAFESFRNPGVWGARIHQFNNNSPALPQFGDSISVAVLKLYSPDELLKPENTRSYLTLVVFSFSDRNRVLENSNQEPRVTSFLLDYLQLKKPGDVVLQKQSAYIKVCAQYFTCSLSREAGFVSNH